jgi:hypothetical protein
MRKSTKLLGVAAVAGLIAASASAFTAGGITAPASAFVGGSVSQDITGAAVSSVVYDTNEAENKIESVVLTFTGTAADGKTPTVAFTGAEVTGVYTCGVVTTSVSTCTATSPVTRADNNASGLTITVA